MIKTPQLTTTFKISITGIDDLDLINLFESQLVACSHSVVDNKIAITIEQPHVTNPASQGFLFLLRVITSGHFRPNFRLMFADRDGNFDGPVIDYDICKCTSHSSKLAYDDTQAVTHTFEFKSDEVAFDFLTPEKELDGPQIDEDVIQKIISRQSEPRGSHVTELPESLPEVDPFDLANII